MFDAVPGGPAADLDGAGDVRDVDNMDAADGAPEDGVDGRTTAKKVTTYKVTLATALGCDAELAGADANPLRTHLDTVAVGVGHVATMASLYATVWLHECIRLATYNEPSPFVKMANLVRDVLIRATRHDNGTGTLYSHCAACVYSF
jgi:hypothetical protein